jgi:hypothetical protein
MDGMKRTSWASVLVAASLLGCSSGGGTGGSGGGGGSGGATTATTTTTTSGSTGTGTSTGTGGAPPQMELVHFEGRFDLSTPSKPTFTWSGTSIGAHFSAGCQSIGVSLEGAKDVWFQIEVDGQIGDKLVTTGGAATYPLLASVPAGEHDVRIVRRNEGFFGDVSFVAFEPTGCQVVPSPVPHHHAIEYIGDSITCGYGIEGASASCNFSGTTESAYTTYAAIAARNLDAAAHFIAYSGKGVHQNYGGDTTELMPELWLRTLTNDPTSAYDFGLYSPDLVVVNLGTNDFSAPLDKPAFVSDYVAFLGAIRQRRPDATIVCVTWKHWGATNEALVTQAVTTFGDPKVLTTEFEIKSNEGLGCDSHPNLVTHARLGDELTTFVKSKLGW